MKKYEYKYVKTDGNIESDETLLLGFGLEGWRVHSLVVNYYLLEREISDKE